MVRACMSRIITVLALAQTMLIVVGFIALGIVFKIAGYPDELPYAL